MFYSKKVDRLRLGMRALERANISTTENLDALRKALIDNAEYAHDLEPLLSRLQEAKLLNQDNFNALISNAQYADDLSSAFFILQSVGILNQDNFNALISNAQYAQVLAFGFYSLQEAKLLNQDNFNALISNAQYAQDLSQVLFNLNRIRILNQDNFNALIGITPYVRSTWGFRLSQEGFDTFIAAVKEEANMEACSPRGLDRDDQPKGVVPTESIPRRGPTNDLELGFMALHDAKIFTRERVCALKRNARSRYGESLGFGLYQFKDTKMLTPDRFDAFISNSRYAKYLGFALLGLKSAGMLTDDNVDALISNARYARYLGYVLRELQRAEMLTPENFQGLINNAEHARGLQSVLSKLKRAEILNQANVDVLIGTAPYLGYVNCKLNHVAELSQDLFDAYMSYAAYKGQEETEGCSPMESSLGRDDQPLEEVVPTESIPRGATTGQGEITLKQGLFNRPSHVNSTYNLQVKEVGSDTSNFYCD